MTTPEKNAGPNAGLRPAIEHGLAALKLPSAPAVALETYLLELEKWNAAYNLTAVRAPTDMVTRHLLDSLAVLAPVEALTASGAIGSPVRLLDVGAGAGLPGIPLAVLRPDWRVTLLDSNGKKARFLRHVQRRLALGNVDVAEARVEAWHPATADFPLVISRAFASLADFVSLTMPLLAANGRWLAMKGKVSPDELSALPDGACVEAVNALQVPGLDEARSLVVVRRARDNSDLK